ncbi:MAG: methylated-DNA--[protein]-cysteine S-methyltransferase [Dehalococcoidia bacterium]|nr:methylated-DNA--[protein]-cysteine S-methyltransferase [Dehalococcoidia bacterium]
MDNNLSYHVFQTSMGWIACLSSSTGLMEVTLPRISQESALEALGEKALLANRAPSKFRELEKQLQKYFLSEKPDFSFPLDFSGATPFRQRVWNAIRAIPYGETRTYGWIAQQAGKAGAARAAGQAVGDNSIAIIVPCHRVVGSNGKPGGFGHGLDALDLKRALLRLEGVII